MTEHLIRLRGGWSFQLDDPARQQPARSCTLPTTALESGPSGLILRRSFHAPGPLDPGERVSLRVANVPGVRRVILNDRVLVDETVDDVQPREFDVTAQMTGRCLLILEVREAGWTSPADGWGHVALAIRGPSPGEGIGEP
jgi:hypothetical protein